MKNENRMNNHVNRGKTYDSKSVFLNSAEEMPVNLKDLTNETLWWIFVIDLLIMADHPNLKDIQ